MIFVMMGTEIHPFDRLARAIDDLQRSDVLGEEFFVQLGSCTYEPRSSRFARFLSFGEICENIQRAGAVVTHAGAGSTLVCIQQGKHPVMVPRRARWGEHVDEHQVPFTERLAGSGLATAVYEMDQLPAAIELARSRTTLTSAGARAAELTRWLDGYWQSIERREPR